MSATSGDVGLVVVTGAASGMGAAVCRRARELGYRTLGVDRAAGPEVDVGVDLTDGAEVETVVGGALESSGPPVRALVNAAGLGYPEPFEEASDESWMRVLDVNLMGTVRMCRLVLPHLRTAPSSGAIVNFGSQAGKSGGIVIGAHYSAAKAAVMCLTKSLAAAYGPEGIRVNAVAPGIIDTPFLENVPSMRSATDRIPLGKLGTADEVAGVVLFLVSDESRYITGEIVDVNGGLLMD